MTLGTTSSRKFSLMLLKGASGQPSLLPVALKCVVLPVSRGVASTCGTLKRAITSNWQS